MLAVQELSHARTLESIMKTVRTFARDLTGADGATFVLRDGHECYYADEEAIEPLWKGRRFPMNACVSGWVMEHGEPVVIRDIYNDDRVPPDAYRPTFVRSLAMVPIRRDAPIGAIGNYWASRYVASAEDVRLLQTLADTTSVAMENVGIYENLENLIDERTETLKEALEHNRILMRELQHRVKNNLNTISSLIRLIEPQVTEDTALSALSDTRRRIETISVMYDKLHRRGGVDTIELGSYLEELSRSIVEVASSAERPIALNVNMDSVECDTQSAVTAGIVTNELVTNAIKHAFTSRATGTISVSLRKIAGESLISPDSLQLCVADDGAGMTDPDAISISSTDGMALVGILVEQLGGTMSVKVENGTTVTVNFQAGTLD